MMMAPPQVVGVLLKKPGEQSHSRLSPLDPQDTKIRGELYVEDLNERRIVSVRMGYLWVEGTQMRLPLRALNLRQATSGICQPHVLALGFTLSNSQGDLVATFWADTEPIYWSWVRAIAAELVRQTPFRAQRCLNFLEILTICPRGPVPLPESPTETRRRSRSELRCWLGGVGGGNVSVGGDDSPRSGARSARSAASMLVEDSRRRARSELRGWSSSNSSDEDLLHLGEFRGIETALMPKVETAVLAGRTWGGCSESSEGSDDSLPWGAGCRSSVDSIDSAPSLLPEADTRELRIQRYKEARRRENEARSRRVLEEDAKRRKARQEENNNNTNNNNNSSGGGGGDNNARNNNHDDNAEATHRCAAGRLCDDARNNGNNVETTANNAAGTGGCLGGDDVGHRLADTTTLAERTTTTTTTTTTTEREKVSRNNRNNTRATRTAAIAGSPTETARESRVRTARPRDGGNNAETTRTATTTTTTGSDAVAGRLSEAPRDRATSRSRDVSATIDRNNAETTKTTATTTATTDSAERTTSGGSTKDARWLEEPARTARETTRDRRNNAETTRATTTKTTRSSAPSALETVTTSRSSEASRTAGTTESSARETTTTATTTTTTTTNPFVRAAETVDAITRRLPPLRVPADAPIVRFREIHGQDDARNNNNNSKATGNYNNGRCKADSPPSPGVVRTDSGERRSRARERRNVREKSQQQQQQQQQSQQPRIPENSLKTTFLQERRERLSQLSRIPIASQEATRTTSSSSSSRCLLERGLESLRERGAISLPRVVVAPSTTTFATVAEDDAKSSLSLSSSSCEDDVARLLERCQRVDRYVPVREKLTLFESLSRMGGRLARSTEDLGRSSARPSPRGKQRARSLHDLNRAARSVPVREMCRLFEGEQEAVDHQRSAIVMSTGHSRLGDAGRIGGKDPPTSILKNTGGGGNVGQDVPPCVRTSTRRKHYQK